MTTRTKPRTSHSSLFLLKTFSVALLIFCNTEAHSQFLWNFGGLQFATKAEAEAAMRASPVPQFYSLLEPWYQRYITFSPARTVYEYTIFEWQPASETSFLGFAILGGNGYCGVGNQPPCHQTVEEAVLYVYPNACNLSWTTPSSYEYGGNLGIEPFEHGWSFYVREDSDIDVTVWGFEVGTGNCINPHTYTHNMRRTWYAECDMDLGPPGLTQYLDPLPQFPNVCGAGSDNPPWSNLGGIAKRTTNVCTATEGNPCSPTTGHKTLSKTDYAADHLHFTRNYHSSLEGGSGTLGAGWSHTFDKRLISGGRYTLVNSDGNTEQFVLTGSGDYRSVHSPGKILEVNGTQAQVTYSGGRKESYEQMPLLGDELEKYRLIEIVEADIPDRSITLEYDAPTGLLTSVTDQFGRQIQFEYLDGVHITAILLPDGQQIQYGYDTNGNLGTVTYQDGSVLTYLYEDNQLPNHLTGILDENNDRFATYAYDEFGRVISSEHSGGANRVMLTYVADGVTEVTTPLGDTRTYNYGHFKPAFDIDSVVDGDGTDTYERNFNGWITQKTDPEGNFTRYAYDEYHKTQQIDGFGSLEERTVDFVWDNTLNRIITIDEIGKKTTIIYDAVGRLTSKTVEDEATQSQRTWTYEYYDGSAPAAKVGRLRLANGPRLDLADSTTYDYYEVDDPGGNYRAGDLRSSTNAAGHVTEFLEYDGNGRLTKIEDSNDVITIMSYHPRGWITSRTTDGKTTSFSYDLAGNLTRVTQPDGSFINYEYDDAHRLDAMEDNFGNRIEYTLDAEGNRIEEFIYDDFGVLKRQLNRIYNQLNQLTDLVDGNSDATQFGYDSNGNRDSTIDANLNPTTFEYDALDRLTKTIDSLLGETVMDYDNRDNLTSVIDPLGNVTQYIYDGLDNLIQLDSPDTEITTYEHDEAGNRTAATDARGIRVEYDNDALNRLTDIIYPDSSLDVTFTYDVGNNGIGRLTGMADAAGTVTYAYDARGNLISETRSIGVDQYVTAYAYNDADRLTQITYPSGMMVDYTLDAAGRVVAVDKTEDSVTENIVSNITYEPFGPASGFTYGNGLTMNASFDQDYELQQLSSGSFNWIFGYDAEGNILAIDDQIVPANDQTITYDVLHRLDTAAGSYGGLDFDYDANGNRELYQGQVTESYTYEPQSNRLATQGGWTFTRDAAGNRTEKLDAGGYGQLFSFGDHNRLTETLVRDAQGDTVVGSYTHDGRGQRVVKDANGTIVHFIYSMNGELLGEYMIGGDEEYTEYVYLNGQPVAAILDTTEVIQVPIEVIVDNGETGTSSTGNWQTKTDAQDFGASYLFANKSNNTSYRWSATPPGLTYDVYAWWVEHTNQSDNVTYTIRYGTGQTDSVVRSHKTGGGQWQLLGTYDMIDGSDYVEVTSSSNKFVADAVKWVYTPAPTYVDTRATIFIHSDHLGTARQATNDSGSVVWKWNSTPFGELFPDEDPDGNGIAINLNLRFPGQYFDAESGLHYNYFRTYDPEIGRYIESDPIGLGGGLNTYSYVRGNPLGGIDPTGEATVIPIPHPIVIPIVICAVTDICSDAFGAIVDAVVEACSSEDSVTEVCRLRQSFTDVCEYQCASDGFIFTIPRKRASEPYGPLLPCPSIAKRPN